MQPPAGSSPLREGIQLPVRDHFGTAPPSFPEFRHSPGLLTLLHDRGFWPVASQS